MSARGIDETFRRVRGFVSQLQDRIRAGDPATAAEVVEELAHDLEGLEVATEELQRTRDQILAERGRFEDLFRQAPEPYLVTDPDGVVLRANAPAARLLGVSARGLPGTPLDDFVPADRRSGFRNLLRVDGERASAELPQTPRDGPPIVAAVVVAPLRDGVGETCELRWMVRDVTEARRAQASLQTAFAESREEAEELRELDRWKDAFLAAAAHDLRAPLAVIAGAGETLLALLAPGQAREIAAAIQRQAGRLGQLLDDLLDLDRFTRGVVTADRRPTDLRALVKEVLDTHALVDQVDVDVPDISAEIDAPRTGQILANLLRNAVTHTPPGTPVRLSVSVVDDGLDVVVEDEGPGIPADVRDQVFLPFVTQPAFVGDGLGTGLGLSLVQLFAELHGGDARAEEAVSGGARFVVHLPCAVQAPGP